VKEEIRKRREGEMWFQVCGLKVNKIIVCNNIVQYFGKGFVFLDCKGTEKIRIKVAK
jgi:hypothetical protein